MTKNGKSTRKHMKKGGTRKVRGVSQKFEQQIVVKFLTMLNTVKLFHWKTYSYATHKATDELYSNLNKNIDTFIEVLLGKTGDRVNLTGTRSISLKDFTSVEQLKREVNDFKGYLVSLNSNPALKSMSNSDLYNIRDEILGDLNQFLYLLTFNK
jgi:DNA-binding ferritin-like protein